VAKQQEITVPDIGAFHDVEIIEVLIKPGDTVAKEQTLITLESEKSSLEVPAPFAGIIDELRVKIGDKVSVGSPICTMQATGQAEQPQPVAASKPNSPPLPEMIVPEHVKSPPPKLILSPVDAEMALPRRMPNTGLPPVDLSPAGKPLASPAIRKFSRELGVDLNQITGTGPRGRILREDVQAFIKHQLAKPASTGIPALPVVDFKKFGDIELLPLSRIKRRSGPNLLRSWLNIPHVTQFDEADITELEDFRKSQQDEAKASGVKLTLLAFLLKACAKSLKAFPTVNSSLSEDGESLILKQYVHIGIAVSTEEGLVVPVIRDVDKKGVYQVAQETAELAELARSRKLKPDQMQGGCFTISSLGSIGGTAFTPIINAPEVAILGISQAKMQPVWDGTEFTPRLILPLSFSYDHRVIDGADAARFTTHLAGLLADLRRILL